MEIAREIDRHLEWIEFVSGLLGTHDVGDAKLEELSRHDLCALGQWLDSPEAQKYQGAAALPRIRQRHEDFHRLAGELATAVAAGRDDDAMALQARFVETSQDLIGNLYELREAGAKGST